MTKGVRSDISADDVVARIHDEVTRRRTADERVVAGQAAPSSSERPAADEPLELPRLRIQPPFEPRASGVYPLAELAGYHDQAFIENAYRALLGRMPDPVGLRHQLDRLRGGTRSKIAVLGRLRYSPEGRKRGVKVRGLLPRFALEEIGRIPLLGYLVGWVVALVTLPRTLRHTRHFESYTLHLLETTAAHISGVASQIEQQFAAAARVDQRLGEEIRRSGPEIERSRQQSADQLSELSMRLDEGQLRIDNAERYLGEHDSAVRAEIEAREAVSGRVAGLASELQAVVQSISQQRHELTSRLDGETRAREANAGVVSSDLAAARVRVEAQSDLIRMLEAKVEGDVVVGLEQLEESLRETSEAIGAIEHWARQETAAREGLGGQIAQLAPRGAVDRLKAQSSHLQLQLARLLEEARRRLPAPLDEDQLRVFVDEEQHHLDAFYAGFEDEFRGSREDIKERLRVYLPLIDKAHPDGEQGPLLDLGCGRGEWLELAGESGLDAVGVDRNRAALDQCKERGLDARQADLLEYLAGLKDASVGVVTGFHIIEHLPLDVLVRVIDETVRVLVPGGLAIFETPNPANILVGSHTFYMDPTHRNPLPARAMEFLAESRGLCDVEVMLLNSLPATERVANDDGDELTTRFNAHFYAARDYALIGRKP